jgi:hypothetical protein
VSGSLTPARRNLATVLIFAGLSAAWSWPLLTSPGGLHIYRQVDQFCNAWVAMLGAHWDGGFTTSMASWPVGQGLQRLDSLVLFGLARVFGWLVGPWTLLGWMVLIGPVLSAWAAERFAANVLGARWPWSLVAGVTYGFSGMAATSVLEGHVYPLLNPWLPLMAWQWHRATGPEGRLRHGLAAGLLWALCLLTSAYTGIAASLWIVVWAVRLRARWPAGKRVAYTAAAVILPLGVGYTVLFLTGGDAGRGADAFVPETLTPGMAAGFGSLAALAGPLPGLDTLSRSISPALGFLPLALLVCLRWVRPERGPWKLCLLVGAIALVVALGPPGRHWLEPGHESPLLQSLGSWGPLSLFRFPVRLAWVTALAWGAVSAAVLSQLATRSPRRAAPLLLIAVLDVLVVTGMPGRGAHLPWDVPSAYRSTSTEGAVLALLPEFDGHSTFAERVVNDLECAYQIDHGRPILNVCVETSRRAGPRRRTGAWLRSSLLRGESDREIVWRLAVLGVGSVVWRPDLFFPADRQVIGDGLVGALGQPVAASRDGGEYIVVFRVPDPAPREVAMEQWYGW